MAVNGSTSTSFTFSDSHFTNNTAGEAAYELRSCHTNDCWLLSMGNHVCSFP